MWGLVNNAGISTFGEVEFTSMETYKEVAEVNLWGTVRTTKSFLPLIRRAKGELERDLPPLDLPHLFIFAQNGNRSQQIQHLPGAMPGLWVVLSRGGVAWQVERDVWFSESRAVSAVNPTLGT